MVLSLAKGAICRSEPAVSGEVPQGERRVPRGELQLLDISRHGSKISRLCSKISLLCSFAWRCCCEIPLRPASSWRSPEDRLRRCVKVASPCRKMAPLEAHSLRGGSRWMHGAARRRERLRQEGELNRDPGWKRQLPSALQRYLGMLWLIASI